MNEVHHTRAIEDGPLEGRDLERIPVTKLAADPLPEPPDRGRRSFEPWLLGGGALLLLVGGLAFGASQLSAHNRQVIATSEQQQNFVPNVRVSEVRASDSTMVVSLPATTLAFAAANIFARANGYIEKRQVDIGDHVKAGDLLAQITARNSIIRSPKTKQRSVKTRRRCSKRQRAGTWQASPTRGTAS
jgi:hypothetical protein